MFCWRRIIRITLKHFVKFWYISGPLFFALSLCYSRKSGVIVCKLVAPNSLSHMTLGEVLCVCVTILLALPVAKVCWHSLFIKLFAKIINLLFHWYTLQIAGTNFVSGNFLSIEVHCRIILYLLQSFIVYFIKAGLKQ